MIAEVEPENLSGDAPLTAPLLETRVNIQEVIQTEQERKGFGRAGNDECAQGRNACQSFSNCAGSILNGIGGGSRKGTRADGRVWRTVDRMLALLNEQPAAINRISQPLQKKDYAAAQRVARIH